MKIVTFLAFLFVAALGATAATAQPAPFNDAGVTMGHWHLALKDPEAGKKIFLGMGGRLFMPGGQPLIMFPGIYINLTLGNAPGEGGSRGTTVNHVSFLVDNVQQRVAQWKAAGVPVLPGGNGRLDQAFVEVEGLRIEIQEDKTQGVPIRSDHLHMSIVEADIPKAQAWYAKTFGGEAITSRLGAPIVRIPGVEIRFLKADKPQAPTKGHVLDHIGFDVKDHAAFVKMITSQGVKLDDMPRMVPNGSTIVYITDPWGTRIEIVQRSPLGPEVKS